MLVMRCKHVSGELSERDLDQLKSEAFRISKYFIHILKLSHSFHLDHSLGLSLAHLHASTVRTHSRMPGYKMLAQNINKMDILFQLTIPLQNFADGGGDGDGV